MPRAWGWGIDRKGHRAFGMQKEGRTMQLSTRSIAMTLVALLTTPALAEPEQDYVTLMTAIEVDRACVALKYMETVAVGVAAQDYLARTPQYGTISSEDFDVWRAGLDQTARENASVAGCTEQAMSYVLPAKAIASARLYQGLMLAFHFNALPDGDAAKIPLDVHKINTAKAYEGYLQQLYGEGLSAFVDEQRQFAAGALPPGDADMLTEYGSTYDMLVPEVANRVSQTQGVARNAINLVQFEVTAEASGHQVRPHAFPNHIVVPSLVDTRTSDVLTVVDGPSYQLVEGPDGWFDELYHVVAVLPDRRLRIMFYGDTAGAHMSDPTVRVYVNYPMVEDASFFSASQFRDGARAFDAIVVAESCLGGPCFDLPKEVTEEMLGAPEGDFAELFVSFNPDAEPVPIGEEEVQRAAIGNGPLQALLN